MSFIRNVGHRMTLDDTVSNPPPPHCFHQETRRVEGPGPRHQPSFPALQRHPENRLPENRRVPGTDPGSSQVLLNHRHHVDMNEWMNERSGKLSLFTPSSLSPTQISSPQSDQQRVLWRWRWHLREVLSFHQEQPEQQLWVTRKRLHFCVGVIHVSHLTSRT